MFSVPVANEGCIQGRIDEFCITNTGFHFARYNRQKGKWRCYETLAPDGELARECINDSRERINCKRHADDSVHQQLDAVIKEQIADTCERIV